MNSAPEFCRLTLIINPASGGGRAGKRAPGVVAALQDAGHDVSIHYTRTLEDGRALGQAAIEAGRVAVAVGGDGIVSSVANAVASNPGAAMGIVPLGRGNDFARALGIKNVDSAVKALGNGTIRTVDLGFARDRFFTCIASFGFDSRVIETAERIRAVRGRLVYPYATVKSLTRWRPARFSVDFDGRTEEITGYSVAAANGGYFGGGMHLAPDASLSDGLFDVVAISQVARLRFLAQGHKVFRGSHVGNPEVKVWRTAKITFRADQPFVVYADGEAVGPAPVTIEVRPGALRILAPRNYDS